MARPLVVAVKARVRLALPVSGNVVMVKFDSVCLSISVSA